LPRATRLAPLIKHEFLKRLQARYSREGIVTRALAPAPVVTT